MDSQTTVPPPAVAGKFLTVGARHFLIKGVSYGTFAPDAEGRQYPDARVVARDFARMREAGINTVRTYTVPPDSVLDEAARQRLRVVAGVPWPQHVAFLDDRRLTAQIRRGVAEDARRVAAHPAVLLCAVGNEIPAGVVRWHGYRRIEAFLHALHDDARAAAPEALLTYVNYPPTHFLDLPWFDVCAFNVYLHDEEKLRAYIAQLHHVAGCRPLLLTEAGADAIREGADGQAALTSMQLRAAFTGGACGAVAFSWTDEWWRGGQPVEDWAFGLVDAGRRPKPALGAVTDAFAAAPFPAVDRTAWPRVSVLVCAYNAADTLDDCLASLEALDYPAFEIVVVNDGSTDGTSAIARRYRRVRVIDTPNGGLSVARNVALAHATGDIVAYTDADVRAHPQWLTYLVQPFLERDVAGAGGPNVVPPDDPWLAQCVARSPGAPTHVMLDDVIAEHVPGCNMAFRREALLALGGFNPIFGCAADDVDVCWRFQAVGAEIGFAPAALVWHHHRSSLRAYWKQQFGYGQSEAWLTRRHPEKFVDGRARWSGRIYSPLPWVLPTGERRINAGVWGMAPFPSVYHASGAGLAFPAAPGAVAGAVGPARRGGMRRRRGRLSPAGYRHRAVGDARVPDHGDALHPACAARRYRCPAADREAPAEREPRRLPVHDRRPARPPAARARVGARARFPVTTGRAPASTDARVRAGHADRQPVVPRPLRCGISRSATSGSATAGAPCGSHAEDASRTASGASAGRLVRICWPVSHAASAARPSDSASRRTTAGSGTTSGFILARWGRLDLLTILEEHAQGRCLLRTRMRLRMSPFAVTLGAALAAASGLAAALGLGTAAVVAGALAAGMTGAALRRLARVVPAIRLAVARAARGCGFEPLDAPELADRGEADGTPDPAGEALDEIEVAGASAAGSGASEQR